VRFAIQNIADWVLEYLFENKVESDRQLHWICANDFLTRDEIVSCQSSLNAFSKSYDRAIEGLKGENYIFHNEQDNVFVYSEIQKEHIKPLLIQKKISSKIKCFYIAEFENGCKVGMTTNLKNRAMDYCKPWNKALISLKVVQSENPIEIENHLKKCLKNKTKSRSTEFFYLKYREIEKELLAFDPFATLESYEFQYYLPS